MDVGRAFTFAFEDPNWLKKSLIGGALLLIPIVGWFIVGGYWMRVMRVAYSGKDVPLPEWDELGEDFALGLKGVVALFIWSLPFIAVFLTLVCFTLPYWIAVNADKGALTPLFGVIGVFGWIGIGLASILFQVFILVIQPVVLGRIAINGDLAAGFRVREIVREIRSVPVPLLILVALEYGIRTVAGFGIFLCVIGVVFITFGGFVILSHLYGQLRRVIEDQEILTNGPVMPA
jgi:hypothetical protein